jgi:hypothetical protein
VTGARTRAIARAIFDGNAPLWAALLPPVVFVAAALQLAVSGVDPDYWWHITTGRWMLDQGRVPFADPFSYTHGGQNWYAHEWLSELLFAIVDRVAGYAGEILVTAAIVAAGGWLLARAARYYGAGAREALVLVVGSGFFILGNLAVRPQVWGWALLALLLHELAADDNGRRRNLWHVPAIFALWINIHLSVMLGAGLLALYALHRTLRWLFARTCRAEQRRHLIHVFLVAVLSALALCLNPRGPALIWFTRVYLNQDAVRYRYIGEWQRPTFTGNNRWLFIGAAVVVLLVAMAMVSRRRLWPGAPVPLFAVAALRAIRYVPVFAVVSVPALGWAIGGFRGRKASLQEIALPRPRVTGPLLVLGTIAALWIGAQIDGAHQFRRKPDPVLGGYPVGAVAWIKQNVPEGLVFNEYGWGGYLIHEFYPQRRVYMDGREEMYGEKFFADFVNTIGAAPGWQQTLADAGVRATVVDPRGPLAAAMDNDPGWKRAFADNIAAVYIPAGSEASHP